MAYQNPTVKIGTLVAGADLSAKQYHFVKLNSSGAVISCAVAGEQVFGVLQNKPTSGQAAEVVVFGATKIVGSASIAKGALVMTTNAGRAVTAATAESKIVGWMLDETAGADGEVGTIHFTGSTGMIPSA